MEAHKAMSDPIIETHPVQTSDSPSYVPKVVTMQAYEVYCTLFGRQEALVTGWCVADLEPEN